MSSNSRGFERAHVALDLARDFIFGHFQVLARLQVHPKCRAVLEVTREAQSRVRRDPAPLVDDVSDARHRDAEVQTHPVHAQAERLHEFLAENLARMDRLQFLGHFALPSGSPRFRLRKRGRLATQSKYATDR